MRLVWILILLLTVGFLWVCFRFPHEVIADVSGAFAGAFFAFLFIHFGEIMRERLRWANAQRNALIRLEHALNDYLDRIGDNLFEVSQIANTVEISQSAGPAKITFNRLATFPIDRETIRVLSNPAIVNEVFNFNVDLRRANVSIILSNEMYASFRNAFVDKRIERLDYVSNAAVYCQKLGGIGAFFRELHETATRLAAMVRILLKETKLPKTALVFYSRDPFEKLIDPTEVANEVKAIRKEAEQLTASRLAERKRLLDAGTQ